MAVGFAAIGSMAVGRSIVARAAKSRPAHPLLLVGMLAALPACDDLKRLAGLEALEAPESVEVATSAAPSAQSSAEAPAGPSATAREVAPTPGDETPDGYMRVEVAGVRSAGGGAAVLLADVAGDRVVPIFVGGTEALSISLRFERERYARPLTHDLLDSMVESLGGHATKVQVDELKNNVFYGTVYVEHDGKLLRVDARPSDAIAIALGNRIPIYMAAAVMEEAGLASEDVLGPDGITPSAGPDSDPLSL
jgi:uncharacterized protein